MHSGGELPCWLPVKRRPQPGLQRLGPEAASLRAGRGQHASPGGPGASCLSSWGQRRSGRSALTAANTARSLGPALRGPGSRPGSGLTWTPPWKERPAVAGRGPRSCPSLEHIEQPGSRWLGRTPGRRTAGATASGKKHPIQGTGDPDTLLFPLQRAEPRRLASALTQHLLARRVVYDTNK